MSVIAKKIERAHKLVAGAGGVLAEAIAKRKVNLGQMAMARASIEDAAGIIAEIEDLAGKKKDGEFTCPRCGAAGATKDGCAICAAGPNG